MKNLLCSLLTLSLTVACGRVPSSPTAALAVPAGALAVNPCDVSPCQWNDLGPQPVGSTGTTPSLVVAQGLPVVAWSQTGGGSFSQNAFVRVKTGTVWEAAQQLNDAASGSTPALAENPGGTGLALVAFAEQRKTGSVIRLKSRAVVNGASVWTPFDRQTDSGLGTPGRNAANPSVVTTPGFTAVAWDINVPGTLDREVFVWMSQGGVWKSLGTRADGSVADGGSPQLAVNAGGSLALAFLKNSGGGPYYPLAVRTWNSRSLRFVSVPDPFSGRNSFCGGRNSLGVTDTGALVATVCDGAPGTLVVQQFADGGPWTTLGAPLNVVPPDYAANPSLKVSGSAVTVAWDEFTSNGIASVYAKRWNSASQTWTPFGAAVNVGGSASGSALAVFPNGNPLVAFTQPGQASLYVRHWSRSGSIGTP